MVIAFPSFRVRHGFLTKKQSHGNGPTLSVYQSFKALSMGPKQVLRFIQNLHLELCVKCGLAKWEIMHYNVNRKRQEQQFRNRAKLKSFPDQTSTNLNRAQLPLQMIAEDHE